MTFYTSCGKKLALCVMRVRGGGFKGLHGQFLAPLKISRTSSPTRLGV